MTVSGAISAQEQARPEQQEMPFAVVLGEPYTELPRDLYIPPDALEVILDAFEGPLDLLLYLIRRQNLDILDIPIAEVTAQYMQYIEMMNELRFELAAEYLLMAAMLAEIKSRMLLPRAAESEEEETDPRAELVRRLQEYERYKQAAEDIDRMPQLGRDVHPVGIEFPDRLVVRRPPDLALREILVAFRDVMQRAALFSSHHVQREPLSMRERMTRVLDAVRGGSFVEFTQLFDITEGRLGVVVTFMAVLELIKEALIELVQTDSYGPIHVKARGG